MLIITILLKYILPIALFYLFGIYLLRMTLKTLLWHCAGANVELLKKCPNDHSRYMNIGATIIMTALLAWISMGFALYSVFNSFLASLLVGLVWACMIFILDRTIVTSMQKPVRNNIQAQGVTLWGNQNGSWGKITDVFREIGFTLIRLIIAILISFVITKPLEIKIFEDRLRPVLDDMKSEQASKDSAGIWNSGEITVIRQDAAQISENIEGINEKLNKHEKSALYNQLNNELIACNKEIAPKISAKNGEIERQKAIIGNLKRQLNENNSIYIERQLGNHRGQISNLQGDIGRIKQPCIKIASQMTEEDKRYRIELSNDLNAKKEKLVIRGNDMEAANQKAFEESSKREGHRTEAFKDNIIPQIQALEVLKSKDDAMKWTSRLIMLMFIIIETAPVLAKLFSKRGQYDDEFEEAEITKWIDLQESKAIKIKQMNEKITESDAAAQRNAAANAQSHANDTAERLQLDAEKRKEAFGKELSNYSVLVDKIADAQKEIALEQVRIWKEEQLLYFKRDKFSHR